MKWVQDAWKCVATADSILKGFRQCGYIEYTGDAMVLHSRLQETLRSRKVPEDLILEVDRHIAEMMALDAEEETAADEGEIGVSEFGDDVECEESDSEMADSQGGAEGEIDTDTDMIIVV